MIAFDCSAHVNHAFKVAHTLSIVLIQHDVDLGYMRDQLRGLPGLPITADSSAMIRKSRIGSDAIRIENGNGSRLAGGAIGFAVIVEDGREAFHPNQFRICRDHASARSVLSTCRAAIIFPALDIGKPLRLYDQRSTSAELMAAVPETEMIAPAVLVLRMMPPYTSPNSFKMEEHSLLPARCQLQR